jgi:formate--tetrahydrofolate ligase
MRPISDVAADLGLAPEHLIPYGHHIAKVRLEALDAAPRKGRLVLVSAITPTPAGEGKTTTSIGLTQGLRRLGHNAVAALREPSLGPCFGVKGGGTGGGQSKLEPSAKINLHFTGDFHAVTAAHNLLAAMIDNHLHHGNPRGIDPHRVVWPRVLDVNDRALRNVLVGLGGKADGVPREASFDITAASEVMAVLCLATDRDDLRARLGRLLVAWDNDGQPVRAHELGAVGAMCALLDDAILPNLVQTTEGAPAIVHGGPFANIAHGCNSVLATRLALGYADWVITEAGFGFDLGAEKFIDIKCRTAGLDPDLVVLVATLKALKMHGGVALDQLATPDPAAVARGLPNLERHLESIAGFGKRAVVALNGFPTDTDEERAVVAACCARAGAGFADARHFAQGGAGAESLAAEVVRVAALPSEPVRFAYELSDTIQDKIRKIAQKVYGADDIVVTPEAMRDLGLARKAGLAAAPICMAKTQNSVSDDPKRRGRPTGFTITIRRALPNAGAGFIVVLTGDIMRMPGLPAEPQAFGVDVVDGNIVGVG